MKHKTTIGMSVVQYRPDLSRPLVEAIPLGIVVEVGRPDFVLFAMITRPWLDEREMDSLDGVARRQLESPTDFIDQEIIRVLEDGPPSVLERLADENAWSLQFTTPIDEGLPATLLDMETPEDIVVALLPTLRAKAEEYGIGAPAPRAATKATRPGRTGLQMPYALGVWAEPRHATA